MNDQPWTIQRLLDWTTGFFKEKGLESARLDAEVLLADCLKCQRIQLYTRFNETVSDSLRAEFRDKVKRHAAGEPVAYLVGYREFYSLNFLVNASVLIPRPETEHLVIESLDRLESRKNEALSVCDVGTGSGVIAVCLAKYLPQAKVHALDLSEDALQVARQNAATHQVQDRITFLHSDLLSAVSDQTFDLIVSNPPYVSQTEMDQVADSVKRFEPTLALVGAGEDGGQTTRNLIEQAVSRLKSGGWLLIETSPMLAASLREFAAEAGYQETGVIKDLAGLDRVVWARR